MRPSAPTATPNQVAETSNGSCTVLCGRLAEPCAAPSTPRPLSQLSLARTPSGPDPDFRKRTQPHLRPRRRSAATEETGPRPRADLQARRLDIRQKPRHRQLSCIHAQPSVASTRPDLQPLACHIAIPMPECLVRVETMRANRSCRGRTIGLGACPPWSEASCLRRPRRAEAGQLQAAPGLAAPGLTRRPGRRSLATKARALERKHEARKVQRQAPRLCTCMHKHIHTFMRTRTCYVCKSTYAYLRTLKITHHALSLGDRH